MSDYTKFANLLNKYLADQKCNISWLAKQLDVTPNTASGWLSGEGRPDSAELVGRLADVLGIYDSEEREKLLVAAGYDITASDSPTSSAGNSETIKNIDHTDRLSLGHETHVSGDVIIDGTKTVFEGPVTAPVHSGHGDINIKNVQIGGHFFIDALKSWSESVFRWSEADEHMLSSWEGMVIHAMSAVTGRVTPRGLLTLLLTIVLWMLTFWLIRPLLTWQLDSDSYRQIALIKFGVATLLVPLLVALVTPAEKQEEFELTTVKQHITLWQVKLAGALVGFWTFSMVVIILSGIGYYLNVSFATPIRALLAFIPLFISYVSARRVPVDRYEMFEGKFRAHEADSFMLAVFLFIGPLSALLFYYGYSLLSDKTVGPVMVLGALIAIALWQYKKQDRDSIPDLIMILILGFVFPLLVPVLTQLFTQGLPALSEDDLPALFMILAYFLSLTLLGATLFVRGNLTWTPSSLFAMLAVLAISFLALSANLWLGQALVIAIVLGWVVRGRKYFKKYLFMHESFWVLEFAIGSSIYNTTNAHYVASSVIEQRLQHGHQLRSLNTLY